MAGDLHTHTTYSDGSLQAQTLVGIAQRSRLSYLAVSDHDSWKAVEFGYAYTPQDSLELIPATELTAFDFQRNRRVHLLCYYPEKSDALRQFCEEMGRRRNEKCSQSLHELEKLYPQFDTQLVQRLAQDSGVLYKTHLIRVLYELGYTDGIYKQLYKELFGSGGTVLHDPQYESVDTVLDIIYQSKGVAVLAHPSVYNSMELAAELACSGHIDGVEIEHPRNTPEDKPVLYRLAQERGLIVTGGSDFHGMHSSKPVTLGQCTTDDRQVLRIKQLAHERQGGRIGKGTVTI